MKLIPNRPQDLTPPDRTDLAIELVNTAEGRLSASDLINTMYGARGYDSEQNVAHDANQITLCASLNGTVIGTVTLSVDSPCGMLADEAFSDQIDLFRNAGASACEITKLALKQTRSSERALAEMFHTLYIYARDLYRCTHFFIEVNPRHKRFYQSVLGFRAQCEMRRNSRVNAPACLLLLDLDDLTQKIADFRAGQYLSSSKRSFFRHWFSPEEEANIAEKILLLDPGNLCQIDSQNNYCF